MRLRSTAPPTFLLTVKPNRAVPATTASPKPARGLPSSTKPERRAARTVAQAQKLGAMLEGRNAGGRGPLRLCLCSRHAPARYAASGRQALAALGSAARQDPAAAGRLHALAEAVPPLANELARLIGTLHVWPPCSSTGFCVSWGSPAARSCAVRKRQRPPSIWPELLALIGLRLPQVNPSQGLDAERSILLASSHVYLTVPPDGFSKAYTCL